MGDFQQNLFARLKSSTDSPPAYPGASNYQHPSVSSPIVSPSPAGPQPRHSDIMSQNVTSATNTPQPEAAASDRTANLLNLLKFNQSSSRQNSQSAIPAVGQNGDAPVAAPTASAADLSTSSLFRTPSNSVPAQPTRGPARAASDNPQDMLLNLLKRPEANKPAEKPAPAEDRAVRETTPVKVFGGLDEKPSSFTSPRQTPRGGVFSYVNPFEQLHASSPHVRSPKTAGDATKSRSKTASPAPPGLPDGRSQLEALMGIGAKRDEPTAVAEALNSVAPQVEQDVQDALKSVEQQAAIDEVAEKSPNALKEAVQEAAVEVQDELQDGKTKAELEKTVSQPVVHALQETAEAIAREGVADSWESADPEDSPRKGTNEDAIPVYNLPMKPFVSLDIKGEKSQPSKLRSDVVMKIASLKKDFDQIDRTLASASPNHIVYAMSKGGGFRVIRQDDGNNKTVFRGSDNQIFNVAINYASSPAFHRQNIETVLATGVNGSVYWTSISTTGDSIEDVDLDKKGFIMPPLPSTDENTSTSQLKTRAKKSSRHPEFFAVGRGKSIYLVWPEIAGSEFYTNPKNRVVDTQRYLHQRCFKIATGKAGKDFTFSEDDTVIVSLDKHGRIKFWDITEHLDMAKATPVGRPAQVEAKVPVMTLWLTSSSSKAWPTSIQFVDKGRPTVRGIALRYLLIGLKQNHTIQLWDLGLGKAVQEINLPHANETDAICSIAYHAKSGIITIGHPTRNSIYLIHLSAPKYNVPSMTQANYIRGLTQKDERIPKPDSTAIMSGLREISLSSLGSMRSIDILSPSSQTIEKDGQDDETVFEIYVMHSRGVTCLNLKRTDFGWGEDGKVLNARDAEKEGVIAISDLQVSTPAETGQPEDAKSAETPSKIVLKSSTKVDSAPKETDVTFAKSNELPSTTGKANTTTTTKSDKKKSDKKKVEPSDEAPAAAPKLPSYADALSRAPAPAYAISKSSQPSNSIANGATESTALPAETKGPTAGTDLPSAETFTKLLSEQMDDLSRRMDEQRRVQEAAGAARQDAVLRLVSATLTENVEKSLDRIVSASIQENVIPAISNIAATSLEAKVPAVVSQQLSTSVPRALQDAIPDAIAKTLQEPGMLQTISEQVAAKLAPEVKKQFNSSLQDSIIPMFRKSAVDAARGATTEIERRVIEQLRATESKIQYDAVKIDQLARLNSELSSTVTDMANVQAQLHKELVAVREDIRQYREESRASVQATGSRSTDVLENEPSIKQEEKDTELEGIAEAMSTGRVEEGTIRWLQSPNQNHLFDQLFASIPPTSFLPLLNPIVNLSVSAAISGTLPQGRLTEKLGYLETVLDNVEPRDPQIAEYAPRMMEVLNERVSDEYMRVAEERPGDAVLSRMSALVRRVRAFRGTAGAA